MRCHGGKRNWLITLAVAMLGVALWAGLGGRGLIGMLPFAGFLLCPLIHGALFLFLGKNLMHGSCERHEPARRSADLAE